MLALLVWSALEGDFAPELLVVAAIDIALLATAFTGIDPTSDEVIPPASARFLELSDPERAIDVEAMTSGPRRPPVSADPGTARADSAPADERGSSRARRPSHRS